MNLGNKILKIRKENKMSQEQFAEVLNVTRQTVSNWENGNNYPDIETLIKISDKFNVSLDILLKGDKEMIKDINKKTKNNKILKRVIIALSVVIVILIAGTIVYKEYSYRFQINFAESNSESAITDKCNLDGKRLKIMALSNDVCNNDKKFLETPFCISNKPLCNKRKFLEVPRCTSDFDSKPSNYNIVDNNTKEQEKELMEKMNINLDDYENTYDLLKSMEDYIISMGGTCDNRK